MIENDMALHDNFRANVKRRRLELKMTQAALAAELGVSASYITQVETGDHAPTLTVVERFAKALKCGSALELLVTPDIETEQTHRIDSKKKVMSPA